MLDSECKCFTGRISRLVNSLHGLDDNIQVQISDNEQIGNIIILCKNKLEIYTIERHKEAVQRELELRKYSKETVDEWLEYIN